jgi:hypothetical protein
MPPKDLHTQHLTIALCIYSYYTAAAIVIVNDAA